MAATPHVLVLGLGITGSSIAATLAESGVRVTAVEQFEPLHDRGSSHGDTRIFRRIPREGPAYVEMAMASWDGWQRWSQMAGESLLVDCGGIDAGPSGSGLVAASEKLGRFYGHPCQMLTGAAFNAKHPRFNLPPAWDVAFQARSGFVRPDATLAFLHKLARSHHARLLTNARVTDVRAGKCGVTIRTAHETIHGDILIVAAGSWLPKLLPNLHVSLTTERRVIAWFRPEANGVEDDRSLPIFCLDSEGGWYGMPTPDGTLKIGHDKHLDEKIDPDDPAAKPGPRDAEKLVPCIDRYFNGFIPRPAAMKACIYTLTPDRGFIIDRHPDHENMIVFSCCSGHGFKYAPAYGSIAVDLVRNRPRPDLGVFGLNRTGPPPVRFTDR